jgi:hypothetical protein
MINQNLSKYCLFNLFEICKFGLKFSDEDDDSKNLLDMKQRISE